MRYIALLVLVLVLVFALSACGSTTTTLHATVAHTTASAAPSAPAPSAPAPPQTLTCGTTLPLATNNAGNPLTATDAIANLGAVFITDAVNISQGSLSNHVYSVLEEAGLDLSGYAENKLSDDAATFSQNETSYMPGGNQSEIDTTYATPMLGYILKLEEDCPKAFALAKTLAA